MGRSLYDLINQWSVEEWKVWVFNDAVTEIVNQVMLTGHIDNPLGQALFNLSGWFDDMSGGMGLGMSDEEQQSELRGKLDNDEVKLLQQIEVDIQLSPSLKVTVTNIDELKKTGDPNAVKKMKSDIHKMFEDSSFGGGT